MQPVESPAIWSLDGQSREAITAKISSMIAAWLIKLQKVSHQYQAAAAVMESASRCRRGRAPSGTALPVVVDMELELVVGVQHHPADDLSV